MKYWVCTDTLYDLTLAELAETAHELGYDLHTEGEGDSYNDIYFYFGEYDVEYWEGYIDPVSERVVEWQVIFEEDLKNGTAPMYY